MCVNACRRSTRPRSVWRWKPWTSALPGRQTGPWQSSAAFFCAILCPSHLGGTRPCTGHCLYEYPRGGPLSSSAQSILRAFVGCGEGREGPIDRLQAHAVDDPERLSDTPYPLATVGGTECVTYKVPLTRRILAILLRCFGSQQCLKLGAMRTFAPPLGCGAAYGASESRGSAYLAPR
jgi:hypothetical protein